jgi:uncharacterized protein (PEP-CTERM system associated)
VIRQRWLLLKLTSLFVGLATSTSGFAGDWTTGAFVSVGGVYTDNVCLSSQVKEGEWIATATPEVRVSGEGARASMDLIAGLEFNTIADNPPDCSAGGSGSGFGQKESPAPTLRFNGGAILVEDWLFLDANAFAGQTKINPFAVGGGDNTNGSANTNTSYRYGVSPYISRRLADNADFLLRYSYDEQRNSETVIDDSVGQSVEIDLGTRPELARFSFGVNADYSEIEYGDTSRESNVNNELSSARVRSAFQINSQLQINGYVGEEWNDFITVAADSDGTFWDVGFLWAPNARVSVAAGYGDRFFGSTPRFEITYSHKRSTLSASYLKDITYDRNIRANDQFSRETDTLINEPETQTGGSQIFSGTPTTISNSPILDERFTLGYRFKGRRTTINLNSSLSEQTRAQDGFTDNFYDVRLSASRALSRRLSLSSSISWNDRQADENRDNAGVFARGSDTWRALLGVQQRLTTNTTLSYDYRYTQRNSELSLDEYEENRFTLTLRYQF